MKAIGPKKSSAGTNLSRRAVLRTINFGLMAMSGIALSSRAGSGAPRRETGASADLPLAGPGVIVNRVSGRLLEADPKVSEGRGRARLTGREVTPNREWHISPSGENRYTIQNLLTGLFLEAEGEAGKGDGIVAGLISGEASPKGQWQFVRLGGGAFLIRHAASGRLLDADINTLGRDGTRVQLYGTDAEGMPNRQWLILAENDYRQAARPSHSFQDAPRTFDLLIVASFAFADLFEAFKASKRSQGIESHLIAFHANKPGAGGVFDDFSGFDDPERIKRAIEYAHRVHRAKYVLLAGDASILPVRWRYIREADSPKNGAWAGWHDGTYRPSELYYASLYRRHPDGSRVFDDWDANGNRRFNEQQWGGPPLAITYNPDHVDGYPDVAVGRVPAQNRNEAQVYLQKVAAYEAAAARSAGRKTFGFLADNNYPGGDAFCDQTKVSLPGGFAGATPSALFNATPNRRLRPGWVRSGEETLLQFAQSCFWISYCGHGESRAWEVPKAKFQDIKHLKNGPNYPIVFASSCDTGSIAGNPPFGPYQDAAGNFRHFYYHKEASPENQIEERDSKGTVLSFVRKPLTVPVPGPYDLPASHNRTLACAWLFNPDGGAIAYFGEAVVCEDDKGRDLQKDVFGSLRSPARTLGDVWLSGEQKYHRDNSRNGEVFRAPRIFLGIMTFFGDPSLRLPALP
jgi:hypothetical protein